MKSKLYKYRIVKIPIKSTIGGNQSGFIYKIEFRKRSILWFVIGWISIHPNFKTEQEALNEIEVYIIDDNEEY